MLSRKIKRTDDASSPGAGGHRLLLSVPGRSLALFEAALARLGGALSSGLIDDEGQVPLSLYLTRRPGSTEVAALLLAASAAAGIAPPEVRWEAVPDLDWVAESQQALAPVEAGRFFVHGSHLQAPPGALAIRIDAGQAFGSGHHESTRGCLLALSDLARSRRPARALDLGCGSGVLAIAVTRLWPIPVLACDIDPVAVRITRDNAHLNAVGRRLRAVRADGPRRAAVAAAGPYELILANILAGPLCRLAGDVRASLAPGGVVILSGLLAGQARAVLARYRPLGLVPLARLVLGDWVTLTLGAP